MHGSAAQVDAFMAALAADELPAQVETLICPPFPYLARMADLAADSALQVGGQSVCDKDGPGAYTGEVSAAMLADVGASHAIVGHSERRALYYEDDETVAVKFAAAQEAGLVPVLCVGETLTERDSGQTEEVLRRQLGTVLADCGAAAFGRAVLAYEPVWAIGTGRTASPEQAQTVHAFLRGLIAAEDAKMADSLRILYGGSVKPDNAAGLFAGADVDGALVGGAALEWESFVAICRAGLGK
ncbi:MAG: triose-phosphate isomerase [Salinisphaera sp.]|nr:triose-phosphate isomerase [Salinisphaera sp.]